MISPGGAEARAYSEINRATCATSLSPRPDKLTITTSSLDICDARLIKAAMACEDSNAGMIPSHRASLVKASRAWSSD